ncbi:MAG: hypothetical protein LBQ24_06410 [Candidatus Peribacteria bacterium]|nr:hypothetical protein [Candidatus Peribacteria bacterium]
MLLAGSANNDIFAFRIKATNDSIRLDSLTFTGQHLDTLSNYRLRTPAGTYVSATSTNGTEVKFSNLNLSEVIKNDTTVTYYLVADANSNTNQTGVYVNLDNTASGATFRSSNGSV